MRVVKKASLFILIFMCLCAFKCISSDLEAVNSSEKIIYYNSGDIYSMNFNGSEIKYIAATSGPVPAGICVTKNRTKIYFVSEDDNIVNSVNSDGTNLTAVRAISSVADANYLSISPDGKKLIVSSLDLNTDLAVIINSDGSGEEVILLGAGTMAVTYSPSGNKIAYVRYNGNYNVCISDADGTNERVLVSGINDYIYGLSWHPDGTKLLYGNLGNSTLMEVRVDGSGSRCVYSGESFRNGVYSPDGYKIVANVANSLYILNVDGSNFKRLQFGGLLVTRPCFIGKSN